LESPISLTEAALFVIWSRLSYIPFQWFLVLQPESWVAFSCDPVSYPLIKIMSEFFLMIFVTLIPFHLLLTISLMIPHPEFDHSVLLRVSWIKKKFIDGHWFKLLHFLLNLLDPFCQTFFVLQYPLQSPLPIHVLWVNQILISKTSGEFSWFWIWAFRTNLLNIKTSHQTN
jgi:hypothetical protein